ncbi:MAG: hypothetical protein NT154_39100 [Verrucomicrobia bacterium]|nr:hypothetical protein [Verrucomicrobiota bacterium]
MKTKTLRLAATIIIPTVWLGLVGCKTPPANPLATQDSPSLAGGRVVVQTSHEKAEVMEVLPAKSELALRSSAGTTTRCKVAPQVENLSQIQAGQKLKATLSDAVAIFLVKNGPPPNAGAGVTVSGSAEAGRPESVVLLTSDSRAKVINVDRSYRLLKLEYTDGNRKEYKIPMPDTLENIEKGDEAVVRTLEPLAICLETK